METNYSVIRWESPQPRMAITLHKETIEAMLSFLQDYPQLAENMTTNINLFIMQTISNARASMEQQADIAAEKVAYDAEVRKPFQ